MTITKQQNDTTLNLQVSGRLDTTTAPQLDTLIKNSLENITQLNLDFSNLEYISSAGLRVLLSARKIMDTRGNMTVSHVSETVMEIFEVTGFTQILTIV